MGGGLSGSRKIAISKRKNKCRGKSTACCSRNVQHPQPQVTEKYGQVRLANKTRNHDRLGRKNCCRPPEPKIETFVKNVTPVSCQTSIGSVTGGSGVNAHSHYEVVINCGNDLEKGVDFFEKNACREDHEERRDLEEIQRKKTQPHLHGYLNGVPIILELYQHNDPQENPEDVTKKNLAPNSHLESSVTKATPCDKGQKRSRSSVGRHKSRDQKPVDFIENGNRNNQGTSPMRKIKSANTSPCSYSKECLSEGYEFSSSKCSSVKHQCSKKCAEKDKAKLLADKNSDSDRKKNEKKKPDKKNAKSSKTATKKKDRKPWISPPIPALKSEPLSDPFAVPRHIWYGGKAYAFVDEEPKPKNTFNSENTGGKNRRKKESKKRDRRRVENEKKNPVKENERMETLEATGTKHAAYSMEFTQYHVQNSEIGLPSSGEYSSKKNPDLLDVLTNPNSGDCNDMTKLQYRRDYIVAPVHIPNLWKVWYKKWKIHRNKKYPSDDLRTEQTLIISRTPPPMSSGNILTGGKTVITIRGNAILRRYFNNCGAEEITPQNSEEINCSSDDLHATSRTQRKRKSGDDEP